MLGTIIKWIYDEKTKALESITEYNLAKKQAELQKKNLSIMEKALKQKSYNQKMAQIQEEIDDYDDDDGEEYEEDEEMPMNPEEAFGQILNKVGAQFINKIGSQVMSKNQELPPEAIDFIKKHSFEEVLPMAKKFYPSATDEMIKSMYEALH